MSEMIRRGAEAALADLGYVNALNLDDPYHRIITIQLSSADVMGMVQAVIEAMREPTEAMVENTEIDRITLRCARAIHSSELPCADIWRAMIDAALGRKP